MKLSELRDRLRKGLRSKPKASEPPKREFDPKDIVSGFKFEVDGETFAHELDADEMERFSEPSEADRDFDRDLESWFEGVFDRKR